MVSNSKSASNSNNPVITRHYSLDGIRGMACSMVLISHIFGNQYKMWFGGLGKMGVWLFFVLSAFLLSNYFFSKPKRSLDPLEWVNYFTRRFLRVFPIFIIVLVIYRLDYFLVENDQSFIDHILLKVGNGHFWTIPVEMKYYILLPIVIVSVIYLFSLNWLFSVVGLAVLICLHQWSIPAEDTQIASISLMTYLPVFVSGSIAALIHTKLIDICIPKKIRLFMDVIAFIIIAAIIISLPAVFSEFFVQIPSTFYDKKFIYYGILYSIFILCVMHGQGYSRKLFESKVLRYIGIYSFSAYLIHPIILYNVRKYIPDVTLMGVIIMVVTIIISSTILYHVFERPFTKINILSSRKKKLNIAQ
ncbi:acyltransferase family protein [Cohnella boryungensis]|uniref:Acyltransferase family protein n=1 Tax=Cohnella boryungensis TaxID=768479 RepID=A0ABV8SFF8_9BACL